MKVTAIKQQVKTPERVSVFVDGKYSFSLTYDQLLGEKLRLGLELDEAALKALKKSSQEGKMRLRALEWLLRRPHSTREFRNYLRRKQAEPDLVDALAEEFGEKGYLDDRAYAQWLIEQRRDFKQRSARAIAAELRSKGVSQEIISELLQDQGEADVAALRLLVAKKRQSPRYRDQDKLTAYLLRQGYSYSAVMAALTEDTGAV